MKYYYREDLGEPWYSIDSKDCFISGGNLHIPYKRIAIDFPTWNIWSYDDSIEYVVIPPCVWHTEEDMKLFGYL